MTDYALIPYSVGQ